ncbi:MAG: hypothetical protein II847_06180 [Ruminobacter sp.]|jgi:hypothetical protein|uniref:Uncharacterized protein n=1 Tax=Ruminobacter amylophilus TaxID=867 RepID=A0A662ZGJ7_9GAMM|nr:MULTISPECIES: hypothetical protein [Ruminobacter]MBQ3775696.1 hypothetical protein [Ruminobacter sp.]SFP29057.1 hypothetical protein SAMN02910344_00982 [Ruminobacter amylophilus]
MYKKIHLYAIAFIGLIITFCTIYNIFNNNHILDAGNLFLLLLYVCFAGAYVLIYQRFHFRFKYSWIAGLVSYLLTVLFAGLAVYNHSWSEYGLFYQIPLVLALTLTHICFVNFSSAKGLFYTLISGLLKFLAVGTAAIIIVLLFMGDSTAADFLQKLAASLFIMLLFGDFMVFYVNYFYSPENDNYNVLTLYKSYRENVYADKYGRLYHVEAEDVPADKQN